MIKVLNHYLREGRYGTYFHIQFESPSGDTFECFVCQSDHDGSSTFEPNDPETGLYGIRVNWENMDLTRLYMTDGRIVSITDAYPLVQKKIVRNLPSWF